jgi:hypothetical protein
MLADAGLRAQAGLLPVAQAARGWPLAAVGARQALLH